MSEITWQRVPICSRELQTIQRRFTNWVHRATCLCSHVPEKCLTSSIEILCLSRKASAAQQLPESDAQQTVCAAPPFVPAFPEPSQFLACCWSKFTSLLLEATWELTLLSDPTMTVFPIPCTLI